MLFSGTIDPVDGLGLSVRSAIFFTHLSRCRLVDSGAEVSRDMVRVSIDDTNDTRGGHPAASPPEFRRQ